MISLKIETGHMRWDGNKQSAVFHHQSGGHKTGLCLICPFEPKQRAHSPYVLPCGSASHAARFFNKTGYPLFGVTGTLF